MEGMSNYFEERHYVICFNLSTSLCQIAQIIKSVGFSFGLFLLLLLSRGRVRKLILLTSSIFTTGRYFKAWNLILIATNGCTLYILHSISLKSSWSIDILNTRSVNSERSDNWVLVMWLIEHIHHSWLSCSFLNRELNSRDSNIAAGDTCTNSANMVSLDRSILA